MTKRRESTKKGSSLYRKIGYILFFLVVFIVAIYQLLPLDKARRYLEVTLSEATKSDVTIASLELTPLMGVSLGNISIDKDINGKSTNLVVIDELNVSSFLYSALLFPKTHSMSMRLNIRMYDGEIDGDIGISDKNGIQLSSLDIDLKKLNISKFALLESLYNIRASGIISGKATLTNMTNDLLTGSTGAVDITVDGGGVQGIALRNIGSGFLKIDEMKLPDITFNKIKIDLGKQQRILKVKRINVSGSDFNADITGNLTLNKKIKATSANLTIKLNFTEEYMKKDMTLTMIDQGFKEFQDSKGYYNIKLEGNLLNPRVSTL